MQQPFVAEFLKPRVVKVQPLAPRQARVVIEPFERGFGHTLGNALRRVLLSSMPGSAITEVEIDGVLHEYTSIEGVQEDVVDILLNLKSVALRMHTRDNAELRLHKKGPGPVTAGDIQTDHDIDVVNPELVIANLTKAGELNMTLRVERGRGYRPAAQRAAFEEQTRAIGRHDCRGAKAIKNISFWPAPMPPGGEARIIGFQIGAAEDAVFQRIVLQQQHAAIPQCRGLAPHHRESGIDLGAPLDPPGLRQDQGAFVRRFANGLVLANPGDATVRYALPGTMQLVTPAGGGAVPDSGQLPAAWRLQTAPVTVVTLGPRQVAVLLH